MHFDGYEFNLKSLLQVTVTRPKYSHPLHSLVHTTYRGKIQKESKVNYVYL
jgi:hypothetical protein